MSENSSNNIPTSFYIVAGFFLVWNAIGLFMYYGQMTLSTEVIDAYGPEKAAWMYETPVWSNAAYAIAVTFGVLASIFLLMRKSWALPTYIISLLGILVQDLDAFVIRDGIGLWGNEALIIPPIVLLIAIVEIWYSKSVANRYYR